MKIAILLAALMFSAGAAQADITGDVLKAWCLASLGRQAEGIAAFIRSGGKNSTMSVAEAAVVMGSQLVLSKNSRMATPLTPVMTRVAPVLQFLPLTYSIGTHTAPSGVAADKEPATPSSDPGGMGIGLPT